MTESPRLARLRRTRDRIQEVIAMAQSQETALIIRLREVIAAIEEEERR